MTGGDELSWIHDDHNHRWDLHLGGELVQGNFVTDEFVAQVPMPQRQIQKHIERKFGVPLPAEAFSI